MLCFATTTSRVALANYHAKVYSQTSQDAYATNNRLSHFPEIATSFTTQHISFPISSIEGMSPLAISRGVMTSPGVAQALATVGRALSSRRVVGEAGSGMVVATLGGDGRIVSLQVNPAIGKEGGVAIAELVSAAVNRAHDALREQTRVELAKALPPNVEPAMILRGL
jgi:DNA-binding protein YbaB